MRGLLVFLVACSPASLPEEAPEEDDCDWDECPNSAGGGELCCNLDRGPCGSEICWFRADGVDYCETAIDDYVDFCYDGGGGGGGGGGGTITCNDGTRSPSCTTCSSGCCSGHGGCS